MRPKELPPGKCKWVERGIFVRGSKGGPRYGISYKLGGQRVRETIGPTLAIARKALNIRKAEIAQGRLGLLPKKQAPLFSEFTEQYLEHAKANKKSWQTDVYLIRKLSPSFGKKRLSEITSWNVEQHKARRKEEVSPATVNRELSLLRRMFNLAIQWGLADKNPTAGVRKFREDERPLRILSAEEEAQLLEQLPQHLRDITEFAINTGMRRGEILSLRWDQVDMREKMLAVERGKTGTVSYVPANKKVVAVLRRRQAIDSDYVFTWNGESIERFDKTWQKALKAAGIPKVRFHDLRHAFATRLLRAGEDITTVRELLGHSSINMTLRYTHTSPERKRAAVERLEDPLRGPSVATP
ncbi:MAG: tyrosine-type recombinase/integrase [Candidatus Krumholzibacteria bacterium]